MHPFGGALVIPYLSYRKVLVIQTLGCIGSSQQTNMTNACVSFVKPIRTLSPLLLLCQGIIHQSIKPLLLCLQSKLICWMYIYKISRDKYSTKYNNNSHVDYQNEKFHAGGGTSHVKAYRDVLPKWVSFSPKILSHFSQKTIRKRGFHITKIAKKK